MKSSMVYKILNNHIQGDLKKLSYKKVRSSMLGYSKKVNGHYINFWFQCSRDGFDEYAGAKFIVQFSIDGLAEIGYRGYNGGRIPKYLTVEELVEVGLIQSNIISKLTKPPSGHFSSSWSTDVISGYLKKFELVTDSYTDTSDIWFRYKTESDINKWGHFLKEIILRTLTLLETKLLN
jgi:hypothetical protein